MDAVQAIVVVFAGTLVVLGVGMMGIGLWSEIRDQWHDRKR